MSVLCGLGLGLLLAAGPFEEGLERADALAAQARAETGPAKGRKVDEALQAYAGLLARWPKDPKLTPRLRRRRAGLLKHAGRPRAALAEYDRILAGRARRKDRARALYDGAVLLERGGDLARAERRYARVGKEYRDVIAQRAKAALARGRVLETLGRRKEAVRSYRHVVEKCWDQAKAAVAAYDALALLAIQENDPRRARKWLRACTKRYEKRATRGDRYGAFVSRLLGDMKAPRKLAEARAAGG